MSIQLIVLIIVLLVLFGGGLGYARGPVWGGSGVGLVILIVVVLYLLGYLR